MSNLESARLMRIENGSVAPSKTLDGGLVSIIKYRRSVSAMDNVANSRTFIAGPAAMAGLLMLVKCSPRETADARMCLV